MKSARTNTTGGIYDSRYQNDPRGGDPVNREDALAAIRAERDRQAKLWAGPHAHGQGDCSSADVPLFVKLAVISEELGETAGAVLDALFLSALAGRCGEVARAALDGQADDMRAELIQVAAVAVAILEGAGYTEFFGMYEFFVRELHRLTMPGRLNAVHCMDTPTGNSGGDALTDFPGDVIRLHQKVGYEYLGRHAIWKEPLAVRNRTMVKDLTHKTIVDDATSAGLAGADWLLIFRKKGANPVPVAHPRGFTAYHGASVPPADVLRYRGHEGSQLENRYSQWVWRQYASSVWDDIRGNLGQWDDRNHMAVLPYREARDEEDEKHVHPLQLDVSRRFVDMRTNPGETVFTPFMGVGSEVYAAVELGRRAVGTELKPSYYRQAVKNLAALEGPRDEQDTLFAG